MAKVYTVITNIVSTHFSFLTIHSSLNLPIKKGTKIQP